MNRRITPTCPNSPARTNNPTHRTPGTPTSQQPTTEQPTSQQRQEIARERYEFTANVSHELKTPLHIISGSAELIANGLVKPEDIPAFAQRIYNEAQGLIQLVDDILRLSHLDEGAHDLKKEPLNLADLATQVVNSLEKKAAQAQLTLNLTTSSDHLPIVGIKQLVKGIIYNLCDNAIKYNRPYGRIAISLTEKPSSEQIILSVTDTGIGIPKEQQSRIFERFYRGDTSHSREISGTGLGLSIVKHAAQLHQAQIELESEPGQGTYIRIIFPKA